MAVLVFGSVVADLVFALPALPAPGVTVLGRGYAALPGGKGANQAVAAARDGAAVGFAGAVGADAMAEVALAGLRGALAAAHCGDLPDRPIDFPAEPARMQGCGRLPPVR